MTTAMRIADASRRTGLTPVTLRYYEEIGLLGRLARTNSGYRLYDEATLDRLAFITRAKQLGCSLDEVGDLLTAWDGGECGPVQERLRAVVSTKLAEAETRIVELMTLVADLQRAAAALELHRPDGPCDDRCGCTSATETISTSVALSVKPLPADGPLIACTLDAEAMPGRVQDWDRLLGYVAARSAIDGGVRLELAPDAPVDELARLMTAEQDCCRFFSFALVVDSRGVALEARAPADALPVVLSLFGAPS